MPVFAAVSGLRKDADVLGEARRQEYRDLVDREVVVGAEMRGQRIRRWRVDAAVSALHHERERHRVLALAEGIAVQLELAAVGCERHPEGHGVTLRAGHSMAFGVALTPYGRQFK